MRPDSRTQPARGEQPTGDLALLLEAEARFAERLAEAKRERERLIEEARAAARSAADSFTAMKAAELEALEQRVRAELTQGHRRAEELAERQIAAWRSIDADVLQVLAETVILPRILEDVAGNAAARVTGAQP
jgi:hypothetical protein